ncbi:MAG: hypothetical protein ACYTFI_02265, partial [Planctomycetota bacterium]
MPPVSYAIALALGMVSVGLALGTWVARAGMPPARRRAVTPLWAGWVLAALGFEVWALHSPGYYPLMASAGWALVGMLFGVRVVRASRRARAAKRKAAGGAGEGVPPGAEEPLRRLGIAPEDVLGSFPFDLTPEGDYADRCLVATRERLVTLAPDVPRRSHEGQGRAEPVDVSTDGREWKVAGDIPLPEIEEARAETVVGGGRFAVRRAGRRGPPEPVARYSNTQAKAFMALAKALSDHVASRKKAEESGETAEEFKLDEDKKPRNCPSCGRPLGEDTKVCPRCVKRGRVLLRLLAVSAQYWVQILILFLLLVLGTALPLLQPYLEGVVLVDKILSPEVINGGRPASFLGRQVDSPGTALLLLVLTLAGMMLVGTTISIFRGRLAAEIGARVGMDLRARV